MRLCVFGDSFVAGVGDPLGLGWVGRLCAAARRRGADLTCYSLGIRGDTVAAVAARWRGEAAARLPDRPVGRLAFSFGVNDAVRGVPPAESLRQAEAILRHAAAAWPTLMIGPPPIDDEAVNQAVADLSRGFADCCRRLGVPYIETMSALGADPLWRREVAAGDGAHPGAAGYRRLAAVVGCSTSWQQLLCE